MAKEDFGPTVIRLVVGVLFLYTGITKLMNPDSIIGLLANLKFPFPSSLGWIILLSEIIFGFLILVGFKVRYTAWPLIIILAVAMSTVTIPSAANSYVNLIFQIITLGALVSIILTGPGKLALKK